MPKCLTRFRLPWQWGGGLARLLSRAEDDTGYVQPDRAALVAARGLNSVHYNNGIHAWDVAPGGAVSNVA